MNSQEILTNSFSENLPEMMLGGAAASIIALGIFVIVLGFIAIYVYQALAWMKIAKKKKYKRPWFAWIPILSTVMELQLGGFDWKWIFLLLIPVFGWIAIIVMVIISVWRIFESLNFPNWWALSIVAMMLPRISGIGIILYMIAIGIVAWKKPETKSVKKSSKKSKKKSRKKRK